MYQCNNDLSSDNQLVKNAHLEVVQFSLLTIYIKKKFENLQ